VIASLQRWGGILVRPRATLEALPPEPLESSADMPSPSWGERLRAGLVPGPGWDRWTLPLLFVLGSQVQHLAETIARWRAFDSLLILANGLALSLITPILVGLVVEGLVGAERSRYRFLPLVPLVLIATLGNLARQGGITLPGPHYLPEVLGTLWAAGLALWIRRAMPKTAPAPTPKETP